MIKEKLLLVRNFVFKNSKFMFPVIIVIAVAVTVFAALRFSNGEVPEQLAEVSGEPLESSTEQVLTMPQEDLPLVEESNSDIYSLIATYYNAYANGDVETVKSVMSHVDETDEIKIPEMSQYIESYPTLQLYSKPGPVDDSWIIYVYFQMTMYGFDDVISGMETFYVCTDEAGKLYINTGEVTEEEVEYIGLVNSQDDVVELQNRVNVEFNDTVVNNADLYYYIQEVVNDVQKTTGEVLAQQHASETAESGEDESGENAEGETGSETTPVTAEETGPVYATATTTVNVRSSDSEIAEKVGKVTAGTQVQVLEQKVNGWSKVIADGKEGYIKTEYLQMAETVTGDAIGTVTAKTTVNVRAQASQDAAKLGVLAGGDSADLLENQGEWSKINYNGSVGYVKTEFVE